jgi:hypothetical protein
VFEHAARRAGRTQSALVGEDIAILQDLLYTTLAEWVNAGFPIWTRQYQLLSANIGATDVQTFAGTVDVFHAYWRQFNPYRGPASTLTGADASILFAGAPNADVVLQNPAGVVVNFGSVTEVDTIGVLQGGAAPLANVALQVLTSPDGVNFTLSQTLPSTTLTPGQWYYADLQPAVFAQYVKLALPGQQVLAETGVAILAETGQAVLSETTGPWTVNQFMFGLSNHTTIELGKLNMDDYWNLPNLNFQGDRSVSCFVDRPLAQPVIKIWPTLNQNGFYNGTIVALARRFIQDPGDMTNGVEVPPRFLEALQWRLAAKAIYEFSDEEKNGQPSYFTLMAKQQRIQNVEQAAQKAEMLAWAEERTGGPLRIAPSIRGYTA